MLWCSGLSVFWKFLKPRSTSALPSCRPDVISAVLASLSARSSHWGRDCGLPCVLAQSLKTHLFFSILFLGLLVLTSKSSCRFMSLLTLSSPWDTLAFCRDVKLPTNKHTKPHSLHSSGDDWLCYVPKFNREKQGQKPYVFSCSEWEFSPFLLKKPSPSPPPFQTKHQTKSPPEQLYCLVSCFVFWWW